MSGEAAEGRLVTAAFIDLLERGTGKPVGDHEVPPSVTPPYCVVHVIPGGDFRGPSFASPDADATLVYQVTSAGRTREQAQWMQDTVRRTVLKRLASGYAVSFNDPAPWKINDRRPWANPGGVRTEGNGPTRRFLATDIYGIGVTPA